MSRSPSGILLLLALAALACSGGRRGGDDGNESDTCAKPCGEGATAACCSATEACDPEAGLCVACEPRSCESVGASCGDLDDGCGGTVDCGGCEAGETCGGGGTPGECGQGACTRKTCEQLGAKCGSTSDGCGGVLQCGTCETGRCGGGGVNKCGDGPCTAESDREFCSRLGKSCGPLEDFDNCDNVRSVSTCGNCSGSSTCGGGGAPGVCGCTPTSNAALCSAAGRTCGAFTTTDNCGRSRTIQCGGCEDGFECNTGGTCDCVPPTKEEFCAGVEANCGDVSATDRCGDTRTLNCGSCTSPSTCRSNHRCSCDETDDAFCRRLNKNCGTVTARDVCNNQRSVLCGNCSNGDACQNNVCACVESEQQICQRLGFACGTWSVKDRCNAQRTVTCGACQAGVCGGKGVAGQCGSNVVERAGTSTLGTVWAPDPSLPYVTQSYGYAFAFGEGGAAYDWGASWYAISGIARAQWNDADGSPGGNAVVVGAGGNIGLYNGSTWDDAYFSTRPTASFNSVAISNISSNYFVIDDTGKLWTYTIRRSCNGTQSNTDSLCSETTSGAGVVSLAVAKGGYAVWGAGPGGVFKAENRAWALKDAGAYTSLWAAEDDDVWVVGRAGVVKHLVNGAWTAMTTGTAADLFEVSGTSSSDVWVSGDNGTLLHWDGRVWVDVQPNTTAALFGLSANPKRVVAVGESGTVVRVER